MRVIYYFNRVIEKDVLASKIADSYQEYEMIYAGINEYGGLIARLSIPTPKEPTLLVLNNGEIEGVWEL